MESQRRTGTIRTSRRTAAMALTAAALATAALTACSSSSSSPKAAESADSTVLGATSTAGTASQSSKTPLSADAVKKFCGDLRDLSILQAPPVGQPMSAANLALIDSLAGEAPPPVKDAAKAAAVAAHAMKQKVTAVGMESIGAAMKVVTAWASNPANCPPADALTSS